MKLTLELSKYSSDEKDPNDYLRIKIEEKNEDAMEEISIAINHLISGSEDPKVSGFV